MVFKLEVCFEKEEKEILAKAHDIIQDMITEMEANGIDSYQGSDRDDWWDIKNKIKDLVT